MLYKGSEVIAGLTTNKVTTGFNIFDIKWSDHLINDIQWLRADTFSWQSGDVYVTAYNNLVEEYSTGIEETEDNITFKRTANGFKIADATQEGAIFSKYNADGIAWYYILDTANKRFKLPRAKYSHYSNKIPVVGNGMTLGLTDGVNNMGLDARQSINNDPVLGAHIDDYGLSVGTEPTPRGGRYVTYGITSDPTKSGIIATPIADDNMKLYFYVGEYAREAVEQTAGIKEELFNNKVDRIGESIIIKSTYVNDTSGYRIWSDGYCEQWGRSALNEASNVTVTFVKNFKDTNYTVSAVSITQSTASDTEVGLQCTPSTVNTMILSAHYLNPNNQTASWKACGYLAEGEY